MAERAQLSRVGRDDHFSIVRMFPTGRRRHIQVFSVSVCGRSVAGLTFYDLADINAVVDAIGPFCDLLRMARGAIGRAFVVWFLGRNLDHRFPSVVAVFVKRISSKKIFGSICQHAEDHNEKQQSNDMLRHRLPAFSYLLSPKLFVFWLSVSPYRLKRYKYN
jgi:hypothetical protein